MGGFNQLTNFHDTIKLIRHRLILKFSHNDFIGFSVAFIETAGNQYSISGLVDGLDFQFS